MATCGPDRPPPLREVGSVGDLLFTTTLLVAFLGGIVALLAPCCVSVMLPAYFASSFKSRTHILGMTLVFAGGVATVILPIGLGATALSRLINGQHALVFSVMGTLMLLGGVALLAGKKFMLPMPGLRTRGGTGLGSVYTLGVFSGAASSCCAPVLIGVAALSAATASFVPSLIVGITYVFGMVAPLAILALVWDRRDWGRSRLLTGRNLTLGLGRWRHSLPLASLLSGGLMAAMGVLTLILATRGSSMSSSGWQVRFTAWLDHTSYNFERALSVVPVWMPAILIGGALVWFVWRAVRGSDHSSRRDPERTSAQADQSPEYATPAEGQE